MTRWEKLFLSGHFFIRPECMNFPKIPDFNIPLLIWGFLLGFFNHF